MTKARKPSTKLSLSKKSIRKLSNEELARGVGGVIKDETATCNCVPPDGGTADSSVISTFQKTINHNQALRRR